MTEIQTIATILHDAGTAPDLLESAIGVARIYDAHLSVLALGVESAMMTAQYPGIDVVPMPRGGDGPEQEARSLARAAETRLSGDDIRWSIDEAVSGRESLEQAIAAHIRFADMVVLQRPYGDGAEPLHADLAEAALFSDAAPVLFVPPGAPSAIPVERVMLAWDDSATALRAAKAALPVLRRASTVLIAIVDPPRTAADRSDPGGALAQFLARHNARCEIVVIAGSGGEAGSVLLQRAMENGCGMMVLGAYGHARLREAIFGGATRHVLHHAELPVIMMH